MSEEIHILKPLTFPEIIKLLEDNDDLINIGNLIECSVPKKRKSSGQRKVSESQKIKIDESKKLLADIKEKCKYLKSQFNIKKLDSIKKAI